MSSYCPHCTRVCPECGGGLRRDEIRWVRTFAYDYRDRSVPIVTRLVGLRCRRCNLWIPAELADRIHAITVTYRRF